MGTSNTSPSKFPPRHATSTEATTDLAAAVVIP